MFSPVVSWSPQRLCSPFVWVGHKRHALCEFRDPCGRRALLSFKRFNLELCDLTAVIHRIVASEDCLPCLERGNGDVFRQGHCPLRLSPLSRKRKLWCFPGSLPVSIVSPVEKEETVMFSTRVIARCDCLPCRERGNGDVFQGHCPLGLSPLSRKETVMFSRDIARYDCLPYRETRN